MNTAGVSEDLVQPGIFAEPRSVSRIEDCDFYHWMDIPEHGTVKGKWDLRGVVDAYLGHVDFAGKRVLELGPASGFLTFEMEKRGAEVISYDIGPDQEWDMVPHSRYDYQKRIEEFKEYCWKMQNAYWFAHRAHRSRAKVVYGSIYHIPAEIGPVDIAAVCGILLHLRDPFGALQSALRLVRETVIVTDLAPSRTVRLPAEKNMIRQVFSAFKGLLLRRRGNPHQVDVPYMRFLPDFRVVDGKDVWWRFSPAIIVNFLGILGFEKTRVTYLVAKLYGRRRRLFTVVGTRTIGFASSHG